MALGIGARPPNEPRPHRSEHRRQPAQLMPSSIIFDRASLCFPLPPPLRSAQLAKALWLDRECPMRSFAPAPAVGARRAGPGTALQTLAKHRPVYTSTHIVRYRTMPTVTYTVSKSIAHTHTRISMDRWSLSRFPWD